MKKFTRGPVSLKALNRSGFTLIEVLVVIGIIAILAAIVIIAINPARQFAQARNSQRVSNVNSILNAIGQRLADKRGVWEETSACEALPTASSTTIGSDAANIDLSCLVPTYIPSNLPYDPGILGAHWTDASDYDTQYSVVASSTGRITVCSSGYNEPSLDNPGTYCVTR